MVSNYCLISFLRSQSCDPADCCPKPLASKIHVTHQSTKLLTADVLGDVVLKEPFVKDLKVLDAFNQTTFIYNTDLEN